MRRIVWRHFLHGCVTVTKSTHKVLQGLDSTAQLAVALSASHVGCGNTHLTGRRDMTPDAVHCKERPNCLFVNGLSDNVPISNEEQSVGYLRHQTLSPDVMVPRKPPRQKKTVQCKAVKPENETSPGTGKPAK